MAKININIQQKGSPINWRAFFIEIKYYLYYTIREILNYYSHYWYLPM